MEQKITTAKSFINGVLVPARTLVNVDTAAFGKNANTSNLAEVGEVAALIPTPVAAIGPTGPNPTMPQQVPPGAMQTPAGYAIGKTLLVAEGSEAAKQADAAAAEADAIEEEGSTSAFDHDGDGNDGGSKPQANTVADVEAELEGITDPAAIDLIERREAQREGGPRVGVTNAIAKARESLTATA